MVVNAQGRGDADRGSRPGGQGVETLTPDQLATIPIPAPNGDLVSLGQVAAIVPSSSAGQIARFNRARGIEVQANVVGRPFGDVLREVKAQTSQIPLPVGYQIVETGPGVPGPTPVGTGQPPVGGGPTWPYLLVLVVPWGFWGAALVLARWSVCVLCVPAMR